MKRVAILIVLIVVAVNLTHRRRHRVEMPPPPAPPALVPQFHEGARVIHAQHRLPRPVPSPVVHVEACPEDELPPPPDPPKAPNPPQAPGTPAAPVAAVPEMLGPEAAPTWFAEETPAATRTAPLSGQFTIKGRVSLDQARADADARLKVREVVTAWLVPDVPRSWKLPQRLVDAAIVDRYVEPVTTQFGAMQKAGFQVDLSPHLRSRIVEEYRRDIGTKRLLTLGGGLGFILICLASLAGYIRADEATKGYYTNRLRLVAAVAVGAAGMALARLMI